MVVNALVTGLIVFRILKVYLEVRPISVDPTLGSLAAEARGTKTRHIMFVIIESGMALFVIQLVRVILGIIPLPEVYWSALRAAYDFAVVTNEMLNVIIIRSVNFYFFFADNIYLARASHQQ